MVVSAFGLSCRRFAPLAVIGLVALSACAPARAPSVVVAAPQITQAPSVDGLPDPRANVPGRLPPRATDPNKPGLQTSSRSERAKLKPTKPVATEDYDGLVNGQAPSDGDKIAADDAYYKQTKAAQDAAEAQAEDAKAVEGEEDQLMAALEDAVAPTRNTSASGFTGAYYTGGPATVAILLPSSDSRPNVRALAGALAKSAALAAQEIGENGLILRAYDTAGDPQRAATAAQQAIADGARLLLGPLFSGSTVAVGNVARAAGVPVVAFTTNANALGNGVYSIGFLPETEVERVVSYAAQSGMQTLAAFAPSTPYGRIVVDALQSAATRHNIRIARVQEVPASFEGMDAATKEFGAFYEANPNIDGILMAVNGKALQALSSFLAYNDVPPNEVKFMGLGGWLDPETFREATLRNGWLPAPDPGLKADFEERYEAANGEEPPAIAVLGYDAVAMAAAMIGDARRRGGGLFSLSMIESPAGYAGMTGVFRFRADGRNERGLAVLKVGRRSFDVLDDAPSTLPQTMSRLDTGATAGTIQ